MKLAVLQHREGVGVNPDCLVALYTELGEAGAELMVVRSLEELATRMGDIQRHIEDGNVAALAQNALHLITVAEQIGMTSFAQVAADVVQTCRSGDSAGQAATVARLFRISDRSLTAVWDLHDLTV